MDEAIINIDNIKENLETVSRLYNIGSLGYTRLAFSKEEDGAIEWVRKQLALHDIQSYRDSIGNLFARIGPEGAPVNAFGSHLDSVQNGGLFDGALGVMVGLECLLYLKENGYYKSNAYELICFRAEEANPLGGTFGSRVITGHFHLKDLNLEILRNLNMSKEAIIQSYNSIKNYKSFLELHIEQGTVLEDNGNKIGIVTNIAGINRQKIVVTGEAGHSGTVPMNNRNDALVSASEIIKHINSEATIVGDGTVATVGELHVLPNSPTIIPDRVEITLEVRSGTQQNIDDFVKNILDWINNNYNVEIRTLVKKQANTLSSEVVNLIEDTAKEQNIDSMKIVSGANHDANSLVKSTKVGMIFVPSIKGISHNPNESTEWEDINKGANLMLNALIKAKELF